MRVYYFYTFPTGLIWTFDGFDPGKTHSSYLYRDAIGSMTVVFL